MLFVREFSLTKLILRYRARDNSRVQLPGESDTVMRSYIDSALVFDQTD